MIGLGSEIDDAIMARRLGGKRTIEPGPTVSLDLGVETAANLEVGSWSKLLGDEVTGAGAHSLADVIPRNHQVSPIIGVAAHDDVDVRDYSVFQ